MSFENTLTFIELLTYGISMSVYQDGNYICFSFRYKGKGFVRKIDQTELLSVIRPAGIEDYICKEVMKELGLS